MGDCAIWRIVEASTSIENRKGLTSSCRSRREVGALFFLHGRELVVETLVGGLHLTKPVRHFVEARAEPHELRRAAFGDTDAIVAAAQPFERGRERRKGLERASDRDIDQRRDERAEDRQDGEAQQEVLPDLRHFAALIGLQLQRAEAGEISRQLDTDDLRHAGHQLVKPVRKLFSRRHET